MLVYHRTHHADAIEREGFRDGYKMFVTDDSDALEVRGIFVSANWPLDENEGADGDVVLELDIPDELFAKYEHVAEGLTYLTYRKAMIPAAELNRFPVRRLTDEEVDELTVRRIDDRYRWFIERRGPAFERGS